jgi:glucokinase
MKAGDPSAAVARAGLAHADPVCAETVTLFVSIYGGEAGNLALRALTLGGLFIGGGIAPKMLPAFQTGTFIDAFVDKGRMASVLRTIPVHVVLNLRAPLLGAASRARTL